MQRTSGTPGRSVQAAKYADLKIKCSKCKFFKSKVHYLGYLVSVDVVQPLPEKLEAIKKLLAPTNVGELCQSWASQVSTENLYPFMLILLTVLLNYSGKGQNSNDLSNAIILSTSSKKNCANCHLYSTQTLTNCSNCLQMCPTITILASYIKHKTKKETDHLIPVTYFSGSFNQTQQHWNVT